MREGGCRLEGERVKAETSWRLDITERTFVMMKQKIQKNKGMIWLKKTLRFRAKEKN